jgi:hypothetical protein
MITAFGFLRRLINLFGSLLLVLGAAGGANADVLYGADGSLNNSSTNLYILDPATGAVVSTVGPIGFSITGLAYDHVTGIMYGSQTRQEAGPPGGTLFTINLATGAGTPVGSYVTPGQSMVDITIDPTTGILYGWLRPTANDLYSINKATGTATPVGDSGLFTFGGGLAADLGGTIFLTGNGTAGALHTIDKTTGAATPVATLSGAPDAFDRINSLDFDSSGTLYAVLGEAEGSTNLRGLATIDTSTGVISYVGDTITLLDAIAFVRVTSTSVPEPSSLLLAGIGLLGLFGFGRRART